MSAHLSIAFRRLLLFCLSALVCVSFAGAEQHQDAPKKPAGLIRSAKSGAWSAATTWEGGKVPTAGARVQVREGHIVIYDVKSEAVLRMVHVAGTLSFAPNQDTLLN